MAKSSKPGDSKPTGAPSRRRTSKTAPGAEPLGPSQVPPAGREMMTSQAAAPVATASDAPARQALPSLRTEEIRRRAFELFLKRGSQHGHDVEDWLKAEQELRSRR